MISGLLSLAGAAILVVIDQLIKHWATAALLPVGSMDVLPGVVELRYCLNDGMAFSMLAGKQGLLIGMTSVMLLAVLIMLFVRKMPLTERAAWTLVLGGGVGNLIDRVLNGVHQRAVHAVCHLQFCGHLRLFRRRPADARRAAGLFQKG